MSCLPATCSYAKPALAYAESGTGETILLLHGSASSGALWRQAVTALQPLYRVVAPDLIGYGKSAPWPKGKAYSVDAEINALEPLLPCCGAPYHLVGHSYGGVVALGLALANPVRVRTLTLIEPVFFSALRYADENEARAQFSQVRERFGASLEQGDRPGAMNGFLDFWSGAGSWAGLSEAARSAMLSMTDKIALDWHASFAFDPGPASLRMLAERTGISILRGDHSPEPMRRLVDCLHEQLPGSSRVVVPGAKHLLPLTHMPEVTKAVLSQLHVDAERRLH